MSSLDLGDISLDSLCTYLPASVVQYLNEYISDGATKPPGAPFSQTFETVVLFADVSGFTALSESLAVFGDNGAEYLARHLNSYFEQLVRIIGSQGGDVFKFAGDALVVIWPSSEESLETLARRAIQAALEIQKKMHQAELSESVVLSVKLGVGVGNVSILHVGGVLNRMEYVAVGNPLAQAFHAEHSAVAGDIVLSPEAWRLVSGNFHAVKISEDGHAFIDRASGAKKELRKVGIVKNFANQVTNDVLSAQCVRNYVPGAILPFLKQSREERWASELRRVAVVFCNLGISEEELIAMNNSESVSSSSSDGPISRLQEVISAVQTSVYCYEGSLNKFLMDDKGSTLLAVFGLPPLAHEDDSPRAVLASLLICEKLNALGLRPSCGVTTGVAFCGVVGGRVRREYSVLGDVVNLSARLMQYAIQNGKGVICDSHTQYSSRQYVEFEELDTISVKGKSKPIKIVRPHQIHKSKSKINIRASILGQRLDGTHVLSHRHRSSLIFGNVGDRLSPDNMEITRKNKAKQPLSEVIANSQNIKDARVNDSHFIVADDLDNSSNQNGSQNSNSKGISRLASKLFPKNFSQELEKAKGSKHVPDTPVSKDSDRKPNDKTKSKKNLKTVLSSEDILSQMNGVEEIDSKYLPIRSVKVFLPNEMGHVTFSCKGMTYVYHIKDKVFQHLKKKTSLDLGANKEDFLFRVRGTNLSIRNENISLDLMAMLVSQVWRDLILVELDLCQRLETIGTGVKRSNGQMNDINPLYLHHNNDNQFEVHERITSEIHELMKNNKGKTIIVEGDMGIGKSKLLTGLLAEAPVLTLYSAANPFERVVQNASQNSKGNITIHTHFGKLAVWREFIFRLIDLEVESDIANGKKVSVKAVEKIIEETNPEDLEEFKFEMRRRYIQKQFEESPEFRGKEWILNDVFDVGFPKISDSMNLGDEEVIKFTSDAIIYLLRSFVSNTSIVLVVDNAIFLDNISWSMVGRVTDEVSTHGRGLLLVLASRPMNKSYLGAFSLEIPREYTQLIEKGKNTIKLRLNPLDDSIIYKIALESLGVADIPPTLSQVLLRRSQGNPLVVKELIYALKRKGFIYIDGKIGYCRLSDDFKDLSTVPVPTSLQNIIGCRLDRLSHLQTIILKTVALIGIEFTYEMLFEIFPIHHERKLLPSELQGLCQLDILRHVNNLQALGSNALNTDVDCVELDYNDLSRFEENLSSESVFSFTDSFVRDVILARLLDNQKSFLMQKINEMKEKLIVKKDLSISDLSQNTVIWMSFMLVRKDIHETKGGGKLLISSEWKRRWCVLRQKALFFYYDQMSPQILGVVVLEGATAEVVSLEELQKEFVIKLNASVWIKKGQVHRTRRTFFMAAQELEQARNVCYMLNNAISQQYSVVEKASSRSLRQKSAGPVNMPGLKILSRFSHRLARSQDIQINDHDRSSSIQKVTYKESLPILEKSSSKQQTKDMVTKLVEVKGDIGISLDEIGLLASRWSEFGNLITESTSADLMDDPMDSADEIEDNDELNEFHNDSNLTSGFLMLKMDSGAFSWKNKWVELSGDSLKVYNNKEKNSSYLALCLLMSKVKLKSDKSSQFAVDVRLWSKKKYLVKKDQTFLFDANSTETALSWVEVIEKSIRGLKSGDLILSKGLPTTYETESDNDEQQDSITENRDTIKDELSGGNKALLLLNNSISQLEIAANDPTIDSITLKEINCQLRVLKTLLDQSSTLKSSLKDFDNPSKPFISRMLSNCDIDDETKAWIAKEFTRENTDEQDNASISSFSSERRKGGRCSDFSSLSLSYIPPLIELDQRKISNLGVWDSDPFMYSLDEIPAAAYHIFQSFNIPQTYNISMDVFSCFIHRVIAGYLDNPYHNAFHALDVLQSISCLLKRHEMSKYLSKTEVFGVLVSGLCHDIRHPGLTNLYQVNARTPLALLYNDQSVLEHYHCATTFRILSSGESNIFKGVSPEEYRQLRKIIVDCILSTDMTSHFDLLEQFAYFVKGEDKWEFFRDASCSLLDKQDSSTSGPDSVKLKKRQLVLQVLVHSADISNPAKDWKLARKWSDLLLEEFYRQGDIEREQNLPISPNCERGFVDQAQFSLSFIDFIVTPLYVALYQFIPGFSPALKRIKENRAFWNDILMKTIDSWKDRSDQEKSEEKSRWNRRLHAFQNVMISDENLNTPTSY